MRFARFQQAGHDSYGLVEGDRILPLRGTPFSEWSIAGSSVPLADVKLLVPVIPGTFYAAGLNYTEHILQRARNLNIEPKLPSRPEPGYRSNNALIAHQEQIVLPSDTTAVQYEGELVVVIGKRAKYLSEAEALSCVLGYTIGNDVSERSWQRADRTFWRSKNSDTFKPMGPWIETDLELESLQTTVRVNGETQITFQTHHMLFGIAQFIATMTQYLTLHPGDVIWMGTEGEPKDLHAGDTVDVQISSIGVLSNTVVASGRSADSLTRA
jgi:2-keto-4-pentenoate hydratase/2-oxohepta-3-ene-1,7-dioic acid hydratase in catechol pathway